MNCTDKGAPSTHALLLPLFPLFLEAVFPNCVEEDNTSSNNDGKIALCPPNDHG